MFVSKHFYDGVKFYCDPCVLNRLSRFVSKHLNYVYIKLLGTLPFQASFARMSYTLYLYHLVLKLSTMPRIRVTDEATYGIKRAAVDVKFRSVVVCYDPKYPT